MRGRVSVHPPVAERITLALSFLVIIVLVTIALNEEAQHTSGVPGTLGVTFDMENAEHRDGLHYVPYVIRNEGMEAISSATLWFDVYASEELVESASVTVQFLPRNGVQTGVYVTPLDPETHTITGRVESLQFP
jgi:uncharacterized protein (TIGR02588 family)